LVLASGQALAQRERHAQSVGYQEIWNNWYEWLDTDPYRDHPQHDWQ